MFSGANASAEAVSGPANSETMNSSVSGFANVSAPKASRRTRALRREGAAQLGDHLAAEPESA